MYAMNKQPSHHPLVYTARVGSISFHHDRHGLPTLQCGYLGDGTPGGTGAGAFAACHRQARRVQAPSQL